MRRITLTLIALILHTVAFTQAVSAIIGTSSNGSILYGVEFKSNNIGGFVERYYYNTEDMNKLPENSYLANSIYAVKYDGVMVGINYHVKSFSNITLSGGIGILNEYRIYGSFNDYYEVKEKLAYEISAGMDVINLEKLVVALRGGINTCTNVFGTVTIGVKLNNN